MKRHIGSIIGMLLLLCPMLAHAQLSGNVMVGPYLYGRSTINPAVAGTSGNGTGVQGVTWGGTINGVVDLEGAGVLGLSLYGTYPGVLGISSSNDSDGVLGKGTDGIHGQSQAAGNSGVWGEHSGDGYGVAGSTHSKRHPAGIFTNYGGGDHLQAGFPGAPLFRVLNNGDVVVRGAVLPAQGKKGLKGQQGYQGLTGDTGDPGDKGPRGPAGMGRTVAMCGHACGCKTTVIAVIYAGAADPLGCSVTSDTGSCSISDPNNPGGTCCVCLAN